MPQARAPPTPPLPWEPAPSWLRAFARATARPPAQTLGPPGRYREVTGARRPQGAQGKRHIPRGPSHASTGMATQGQP